MNVDTLHAAALVDLIWGGADERRISRDRAISYLEMALPLSDSSARVLADLAAAQLARATHDGDRRALFLALDAAEASIARPEAPAPAAAFNAALALDAIQLPAEAARAWSRYADLDARSDWAAEATQRQRATGAEETPGRPSLDASHADIAVFAARYPQPARALAMDEWLGAWGRAYLAGDHRKAAGYFGAASALARGMSGRAERDHSLEQSVAAIQRAAVADDSMTLRRLARAHAAYARGQEHYVATRYDTAAAAFSDALDSHAPQALWLWATFGRGAALVYDGPAPERDRLLQRVVSAADEARFPAVVSRARWAQGTALLRQGRFERAAELFSAAEQGFRRAGETEYVGATQYLRGDALGALGDRAGAYDAFTEALRTLRPFRGSIWLHNTLLIIARTLEGEGLTHAALRIIGEDVELAADLEPGIYYAEALVTRARLLTGVRDDEALRDAARADSVLKTLPDGFSRQWVTEQLRYVRALAIERDRPMEAITQLDTVIAFQTGRNAFRHVAALVARARSWMNVANASSAAADLESALRIVSLERDAIGREGNREALLEATRGVTDRLIALHAGAGRSARALEVSERARVALAPAVASPARFAGAPKGANVLVVRLIDDTVYAWHRTGDAVTLHRTGVAGGGAALRDTVARLRARLERRANEQEVRAALQYLYDAFVRPVADRLSPDALTIVPDGVLALVPWAALRDASTGRYFVEDRALAIEGSMHDALSPKRRAASGEGNALLVGDPAFDAGRYPELRPLPHAAAEVRRVAESYAKRHIIAGRAATRGEAVRAMRNASVVHYAGHAVSDEHRPERSFLLLAPDDATGAARLTAEDIAALDLGGVRLVVLAACETLGARSSSAIGFRGLAAALRRAGVDGVVGSLWRVHDEGTVELMVQLHRAFAGGMNAADALRSAQVGLIQRGRSPSEWAAFQFTGK